METFVFWAFAVWFVDVDGNVGNKNFSFETKEECEMYKNEGLLAFLNENHEALGIAGADWAADQECEELTLFRAVRPLDPKSDPHSH